jgi:transcriptional regulator with XRE-family HTH domain
MALAGALLMAAQPNRNEHDDAPEWVLRVRRLCAERGWSNRELARQAGMSAGWVSLTINNAKRGQQPRRDTLVKMAQTFNEPVGLWLQLGGLASEDHEWDTQRPSFADFVDSDAALTADQKNVLKSLYISWVGSPAANAKVAPKHQRRRPNGSGKG